jgi:hypothetical protein
MGRDSSRAIPVQHSKCSLIHKKPVSPGFEGGRVETKTAYLEIVLVVWPHRTDESEEVVKVEDA